jgi:hypothetical protein
VVNFLGKLRSNLLLLPEYQRVVDQRYLLRFAENIILDHVVFPKPRSDFAPVQERRLLAEMASWCGEPAGATLVSLLGGDDALHVRDAQTG